MVTHIFEVTEGYLGRLRGLEKPFVGAMEMKKAVVVIKGGDEEVLERAKGLWGRCQESRSGEEGEGLSLYQFRLGFLRKG